MCYIFYGVRADVDFDDLVAQVLPPEKRAGKAEGSIEHRLYEDRARAGR